MLRKEDIAQMAQVDVSRIRTIQIKLRQLRDNGVLLKIHCMGTSAIDGKASNAERGIADDDPRAKRLTAGRIKTIPDEYASKLVSLREASRTLLDNISFDITGFRPWRYVPVEGFAKWLASQEAYEAEFNATKEACANAIEAFKASELERVANMAERNWRAIWANAERRGELYEVKVDGLVYTKRMFAEFERNMYQHTISRIPSATEIMANMSLSWEVGGLENAADVMNDVVGELSAEEAMHKARRAENIAALDALESGRELRKANAEQEEELKTMRAVVAERIKAQLQALPDPGVEMIEQIRDTTGNVARSVRQSIDDKGRLYKGSSIAINNMVERFDTLNQGDNELEALINELRARMSVGAGNYEYSAIGNTLRNIERVCSQKANNAMNDAETMLEVMALPGTH